MWQKKYWFWLVWTSVKLRFYHIVCVWSLLGLLSLLYQPCPMPRYIKSCLVKCSITFPFLIWDVETYWGRNFTHQPRLLQYQSNVIRKIELSIRNRVLGKLVKERLDTTVGVQDHSVTASSWRAGRNRELIEIHWQTAHRSRPLNSWPQWTQL